MKNFYRNLILFGLALVVMSVTNRAMAQRTVEVPSGSVLSDVILGDTTATGTRVDDNTMYVLERNGFYLVAKTLTLEVPLQIKTKAGDGEKAIVMGQPNTSNKYPILIDNKSDIYLESIYLSNFTTEASQPTFSGFRISGENSNVIVKDCYIEWDKGTAIRVGANGVSISMENCRVAKMGNHNQRNGNGRLVDTREFSVHKIDVRNTTFYYLADRIIRNMQGGTIDSMIFDHNTGYHIQGFHGVFHMGKVGYCQITNNLIVNPKFMGNHTNVSEQTGPEPDRKNHYLVTADTIMANTKFVIHHNNFVYQKEVLDFFNSIDSISKPEVLAPIVAAAMGDKAKDASFEELVELKNMPALPVDYMYGLFTNPNADPTPENYPDEIGIFDIDASYSATSKSATGADDGSQLGDLNWWDGPIQTVGVNSLSDNHLQVSLYPNPASSYLQVQLTAKNATDASLQIMDISGRTIFMNTQKVKEGRQSFGISVSDFPAGLYLYKVNTNEGSSTGKIRIAR